MDDWMIELGNSRLQFEAFDGTRVRYATRPAGRIPGGSAPTRTTSAAPADPVRDEYARLAGFTSASTRDAAIAALYSGKTLTKKEAARILKANPALDPAWVTRARAAIKSGVVSDSEWEQVFGIARVLGVEMTVAQATRARGYVRDHVIDESEAADLALDSATLDRLRAAASRDGEVAVAGYDSTAKFFGMKPGDRDRIEAGRAMLQEAADELAQTPEGRELLTWAKNNRIRIDVLGDQEFRKYFRYDTMVAARADPQGITFTEEALRGQRGGGAIVLAHELRHMQDYVREMRKIENPKNYADLIDRTYEATKSASWHLDTETRAYAESQRVALSLGYSPAERAQRWPMAFKPDGAPRSEAEIRAYVKANNLY
jgi:hypothetical protein